MWSLCGTDLLNLGGLCGTDGYSIFCFKFHFMFRISGARSNDVVRRWVDSENRLVTEKLVGNDFPVPSIIRSTFLKCTGIDFPKIVSQNFFIIINLLRNLGVQCGANGTRSRSPISSSVFEKYDDGIFSEFCGSDGVPPSR